MTTTTYSMEDLRSDIQKAVKDAWEKENSVEIIVTYDCLEDRFRNALRDVILKGEYKAVPLSESTYYLNNKYTYTQINNLINEIINVYEGIINESKQARENSIVRLIFPNGKVFQIFDLNLKP